MVNDILGDAAVGLFVARAVRQRLLGVADCAVRETMEMGLALLDEIVGCEHLILVDAIETGAAQPGHIHTFDGQSLSARRIGAPHFVGIAETLALGSVLGLAMPGDVQIFAIEVKAEYTVRAALSPAVQRVVGEAAWRIAARARRLARSPARAILL